MVPGQGSRLRLSHDLCKSTHTSYGMRGTRRLHGGCVCRLSASWSALGLVWRAARGEDNVVRDEVEAWSMEAWKQGERDAS